MKRQNQIANCIMYVVLLAVTIITIFPLFYAVMQSLRTNIEIMVQPEVIIPTSPTLNNYREIMQSEDFNLPTLLMNSIVYTAAKVIIAIVVSSMAAYVFARGHFRGKKFWFLCFSSLLFVKLGGMSVYATFDVIHALHLPICLYTLIVVALFSVPITNIYLMMRYIDTIPGELDEAAKIDGASFGQIYYWVILPLMKPIIATVAILAFKDAWNDYVMPTVFTSSRPEQRTLIVALMALKNSSGAATSWHIMFSGAVISLIPVLILYISLNKYFVSGLTAGAVKG